MQTTHYIQLHYPSWWMPLLTLASLCNGLAAVTGAWWLLVFSIPATAVPVYIHLRYRLARNYLVRVIPSARRG